MTQQVGRYTILSQLGRGGMGIVYLAEDPLLNRQIAIKSIDLVLEDPAARDFMLDRLLRDARAAAMLSHPNVVCVYDVLVEGDAAYLVMEYIAGESLSKRLGSDPKPEVAFTIKVLREVAAALDYTHGRGVVHRDVKPANVMITTAGTAKIMDFGIARIADTRTSTPTGMVMGTVEYMAPEQIKGEVLDGRADQFSLAAMAYQMLTGATVFGPHTLATLTYKIVNESPPPASSRNPALSPAVDSVLAKGLSKLPAERFASCMDFAAALEAAVSGKDQVPFQGPVATTVRVPTAASASNRSRLVPWIVVASACVLISAAVFSWFIRTSGPSHKEAPAAQFIAPVVGNPVYVNPPTTTTESTVTTKKPARRPIAAATSEKQSAQIQNPPIADSGEPSGEPADSHHRPRAARALLLKGQELMKEGQLPEAVRSFSQAIQIDADYPAAHLERGIAYMNQDALAPAIADFSSVIQQLPGYAHAYNERAICYVRMHDDTQALADFSKAIELNPNLSAPLNGRGLAHLRRGGYRKALADFDAAIRLSPAFATAYQNRARAKTALGDDAGAKADRETARRLMAQNGGRVPSQ